MTSSLVLDIVSKTYGGTGEKETLTIEVIDDQIKTLDDLLIACVENEFEKKTEILSVRKTSLTLEVKRAQEAFENKEFYVFINSKQVKELDEHIEINENSSIRFLRVIPLAGG
ncbi:MAG: hypothetical protein ACXAEU_19060 [Candidatus Hodarchaeales archaeon]|jgi:hypothetical protein